MWEAEEGGTLSHNDGLLYTFEPNNFFRSVILNIKICGNKINGTVYLHVKSIT